MKRIEYKDVKINLLSLYSSLTSYSFFLKAAHLPYFSTAALYSSITFCP